MASQQSIILLLDSIQAIAIVLGFVFGYRQLILMRAGHTNELQLAYRKNALDFIARYSDPSMIAIRNALRTDVAKQKDLFLCASILNYFEELAIIIKHQTANEVLLYDFFNTILKQWMALPYMMEALSHFRKDDDKVFENVLWLHERWKSAHVKMPSVTSITPLS